MSTFVPALSHVVQTPPAIDSSAAWIFGICVIVLALCFLGVCLAVVPRVIRLTRGEWAFVRRGQPLQPGESVFSPLGKSRSERTPLRAVDGVSIESSDAADRDSSAEVG
jgi:hypothetical protein